MREGNRTVRAIGAIAVVEALLIALLAYLHFGSSEPARSAAERSSPAAGGASGETGAPAAPPAQPSEPSDTVETRAEPEGTPTAPYAVLHGRVTSSAGDLQLPIWVNLNGPSGQPRFLSLQGGHYAFAGLSPGRYDLRFTGTAYNEKGVEIELSQGATRCDVTLTRSFAIRVRFLTPDGEPLAVPGLIGGGIIAVATEKPVDRLPLTELRSHSRFGLGLFQSGWELRNEKLPEDVSGILRVRRPPPFFVSAVFMHFVVETKEVKTPVEELVFVLRKSDIEALLATVQLGVVDAETGEPVAGRVAISDRQSGGGGIPIGEDGRVEYARVPPGIKEFQIWTKDYEVVHTFLRIPEGGEIDVGTFRLHKAGTIEGTIVDADGKPVSTRFVARRLERMTFPQPMHHAASERTDAEGRFTVRGVGRGRYLIRAATEGHAVTAAVVDTTGGSVDGVRLRLKRGTEVILEPAPNRSRDYFVTIRDEAGLPVITRFVRGSWPIKATLVPGRYSIEFAEDGVAQRTIPLEVGDEPIRVAMSH